MANPRRKMTVILPEYWAKNLGAPFNVTLLNSVRQVINLETGKIEKFVIPNERGLLQQLALARILRVRRLSGPEIKFARKAVPIKASALAERIGVSPEHLSRCEAGERALSVGAEKCLRVAILLELFRLPEEVETLRDQNYNLDEKLLAFRKAMEKIKSIINEMTIPAAYDPSEELSFYFTTTQRDEKDLFSHDIEADWTPEEPLAA